ncbi:MAG: HD domain-containing protein, partial [Bifidobacteriaceae bacterium]|nr:HD domain-containing protein [Bifidobacteriaceae bacterium]
LITIDALVASWLADKPHTEIDLARSAAYLWDVREALQQLGRRSAHLAMADQDQVAALMDPYLTADQLLGNLARIGREISYQLDTTLRRARGNLPGRAISPAVFVRGRRQPPRLVPLAKGLAQFGGEIVFAAPQAPVDDAALPLRAGRVAVQTGLSIEPLTLAALGGAPPLPCPWPAEARTELAAWLAGGPALVPAWEALDQAGVVTRLWPEWAAVRNQAQRNPFHRHTVDRHQVEAVALVGSIDLGSARSDLVLTATLFHDLGKRPGQKDHAALGALLAGPLFERMGYRPDESAFMVTLIRHHLLLASLATTLDPSAPETVQRLLEALSASPPRHNGEASAVHRGPAAASETLAAGGVCGGPRAASSTTAALGGEATAAPGAQLLALVDGLAALTEADARAAGPVAWTKLRAELISRLAGAARRALAAGQVG